MENNLDIFWNFEKVGRIENYSTDMWYMEGTWHSYKSTKSMDFEKLIISFDANQVMQDPKKGTRVILKSENSEVETQALILSMTDSMISLRRVFEDEAVKWLLKNVK